MNDRVAEIPVLHTERLILRPHRVSDIEASMAMWTDPEVVRYIGGKPSTEQQTWGRMMNYLGHWQLMGYGYWCVEERTSGVLVGEFGFADFRREITPSIRGIPELGWALRSHVHGKGYATEGLRAAMAWGDMHLPIPRTVCLIDPENLPSFKLAEKLGFREQTRTNYSGKPIVLLFRERGDGRA
jgi:RimJ/RimL family protein N-acetyltransferase